MKKNDRGRERYYNSIYNIYLPCYTFLFLGGNRKMNKIIKYDFIALGIFAILLMINIVALLWHGIIVISLGNTTIVLLLGRIFTISTLFVLAFIYIIFAICTFVLILKNEKKKPIEKIKPLWYGKNIKKE
jgi:hypothetical protein